MKSALVPLLGGTIAIGAVACGGAPAIEDPGGEGTVTIADKTFKVNRLQLSFQGGEGGYFVSKATMRRAPMRIACPDSRAAWRSTATSLKE